VTTGRCSVCGASIFRAGPGRPAKTCDHCRQGNDYGGDHRRLRADWQDRMDSGEPLVCHAAICLEARRVILPGEPWDLGHTPDGADWRGALMAGGRSPLPLVAQSHVAPGPQRADVDHGTPCRCAELAARMGAWPSRCW